MTHGPGSSEDNAVEGKFSRIAFSGTIARNHSVRFFAGATNRRTTFSSRATSRRDDSKHSRAPLRLFAALTFAALIALAPHPAFAQHGGGGGGGHAGGGFGGGGGHFGGGGGFGGSHGGGFGGGGGHASGGSSHGAGPAGNGGGSGSGHSSGTSGSTGNGGATNSAAHSAPSSRFIGGSTWQAPPSAAMRGGAQPSSHFITADEAAASGAHVVARPVEPRGISNPLGASTALRGSSFINGATSNTMRTRPYTAQFVGAPPHVPPFPPRRYPIYPIYGPGFGFGGCFGPFFFGCGGGFYGGGFYGGFGFGLGYGYGYCDPFWGCPAGLYGSYYNGGYYGNQIYNDSTSDSSVSNEFNPSRYWGPSAPPEETGGGGGSSVVIERQRSGAIPERRHRLRHHRLLDRRQQAPLHHQLRRRKFHPPRPARHAAHSRRKRQARHKHNAAPIAAIAASSASARRAAGARCSAAVSARRTTAGESTRAQFATAAICPTVLAAYRWPPRLCFSVAVHVAHLFRGEAFDVTRHTSRKQPQV